MSNNLLITAYRYIDKGICVIATNGEKRAFLPWKKYQDTIITNDEAEVQFEHREAKNLAIICGKPSGNLEVIDVDQKYSLDGSLYAEYSQAIKDNDQELFDRLFIIQTISGGYHLYYRCPIIQGNLKLANRSTTPEELTADPNDHIRVLIETRGQGGYVLAPPSQGYKKVSGESIPTITMEEREMLLELARSFNQVVDKPVKSHAPAGYNPKEYGLSPFEDYNKRADVVSLLQTHGWTVIRETNERVIFRRPGKDKGTSGDYLKEKQWFSVFTTSSLFEPNKAYLPYAVFAMLECSGDYKKACRKLMDLGYGEKREFYGDKKEKILYKKKIDGATNEEIIKYLVDKGESQEAAAETVDNLTKIWGEKICTFWDINDSGKIIINHWNLVNFLYTTGGFSLYYYDPNSTIYRIVQCRDGFIEDVSTEHIKKFITAYLYGLPATFDGGITAEEIIELVMKGSDSYFSKGHLEFLPRSHYNFLKDGQNESYFTFRNGVVHVGKDKMELISYAKIKGVVWKSQVIDFEISLEPTIDTALVEYMKFIIAICGEDLDRVDYAVTLIGYLLHKYKDPTKAFAVILAEETENEKDGGGTGKGIFFKALSKLINTVIIDGKGFKQDKNFAFQRVGLDTNLVIIEDVRKNVEFEGFYPMITEGMTVEKKNKDELFIPYPDSPKIGFTTNYNVNAVGNHGKRRQKVFEFSPFFSPGRTPEDFFGHKLFDDWDKDEWNRFYNLMFISVQAYLQAGIKDVGRSDKIKRKEIRLNFSEEFLEWFDDYLDGYAKDWVLQQQLFKGFLMEFDFSEKDYSSKRFKAAMKFASNCLGFTLHERKNRQANNSKELTILEKNKNVAEGKIAVADMFSEET